MGRKNQNSYQKTYSQEIVLILCQKIDEYRGMMSKYLNNQDLDPDQSEQMPVPQKGYSNDCTGAPVHAG